MNCISIAQKKTKLNISLEKTVQKHSIIFKFVIDNIREIWENTGPQNNSKLLFFKKVIIKNEEEFWQI